MDPDRSTPAKFSEVLDELQKREPIFHRLEHGTSRVDLEAMTETDFWETGASGRRYGREFMLQELERRYQRRSGTGDDWETSDFYCQRLAEDLDLLTYTLKQLDRLTTPKSSMIKRIGTSLHSPPVDTRDWAAREPQAHSSGSAAWRSR